MNAKQEEKVLEAFKWKQIYAENLEEMFLQAYDCNLTVEILTENLSIVKTQKDLLYKTANDSINTLNKTIIKEVKENTRQREKNAKLETKKVFWRTVAIVEGVVITIVTIIILK